MRGVFSGDGQDLQDGLIHRIGVGEMARRAGGGCCGCGDPRYWGAGGGGRTFGTVNARMRGDYCERQAGLG